MKKIILSLITGFVLAQSAQAFPKVELLRNNQLRVQEVREGRFVGSPLLMTVRGMVGGQTLAAIGHQPVTDVLYGFGYNTTTRTGSLYTISQKNFSATLVRHTGIKLPLFQPGSAQLSFLATANGNVSYSIQLADRSGNQYLIDASSATIVSGSEARQIPVYSHPYSGANFIDDGTVRNNGVPSNDAPEADLSINTHSTEHDFGNSGNAGTSFTQMYPNPATYQTRVVLNQIAESPVVVEVMDMNGRMALRSTYPAGREVLNIDVSRIPAGIYTVRVLVGSVLTDRLKLVRREP